MEKVAVAEEVKAPEVVAEEKVVEPETEVSAEEKKEAPIAEVE